MAFYVKILLGGIIIYSNELVCNILTYIQNNIKVASINDVHNGTLTIQKNGEKVQTFSANQSSSVTANITVPTKVCYILFERHKVIFSHRSIY